MNLQRKYVENGPATVIRLTSDGTATLGELGSSDGASKRANSQSGLVLVAGPADLGKTMTLATMVDRSHSDFSKHIIAPEDPGADIYTNKNSLVSSLRIGLHAPVHGLLTVQHSLTNPMLTNDFHVAKTTPDSAEDGDGLAPR